MEVQHHHRWDRRQWVGDGQGAISGREIEAFTAVWTYRQWVGEGQGGTGREAPVAGSPTSGRPSGFSGFGVSDSGGQQWAPPVAMRAVGEAESEDEEAVA